VGCDRANSVSRRIASSRGSCAKRCSDEYAVPSSPISGRSKRQSWSCRDAIVSSHRPFEILLSVKSTALGCLGGEIKFMAEFSCHIYGFHLLDDFTPCASLDETCQHSLWLNLLAVLLTRAQVRRRSIHPRSKAARTAA